MTKHKPTELAAIDEPKPALPTYQTIAGVLEKKNGSGVRLLAWTGARTLMIMPGMLAVGAGLKKAFWGSLISSGLISMFTLIRIYNAGFEEEAKAWTRIKREQRMQTWTQKKGQKKGQVR